MSLGAIPRARAWRDAVGLPGKVSMAEDHYTRPPLALWHVQRGELVRIHA